MATTIIICLTIVVALLIVGAWTVIWQKQKLDAQHEHYLWTNKLAGKVEDGDDGFAE